MAAASTSRMPVASLRDILSDPARSTRVSRPWLVALETLSTPSTFSMNTRWERELVGGKSGTERLMNGVLSFKRGVCRLL